MEIERITLGGAVLTAYLQQSAPAIKASSRRPAVLICAGGGYEFVSPAEGEPVALAYAAAGFQAFTLDYSVGERGVFPQPQLEAFRAVAYLRQNAAALKIDPQRVAVAGFSAGGHLAASVGAHCNNADLLAAAGVTADAARPNAMVLVYPCVTAGEYGYPGIRSVHGRGLDGDALARLSLENYVGPHTPPAYVCHTAEDTVVPVMNPLLLCGAMAKHNVPFELHVFRRGPHGMSLATRATAPDPETAPPEIRQALSDPRIGAYLKSCGRTFSVWFAESVAFLNDCFG